MKIYDCFMFFNELDILEIRLNVLNDKVDYFVLAEATTTHSGEKKELYYEKNKARFSAFSNKIIHVVVDDMPKIINGDRWPSDTFQRNAVMRGLKDSKDDDIIIISDLDEIPNPENFENMKNILRKNGDKAEYVYNLYIRIKRFFFSLKNETRIIKFIRKVLNYFVIKTSKIVMFKQKVCCYFLNGFTDFKWYGSRAVLYKNLIKNFNSTPQEIRNALSKNIIENGGWHFSYQFSPEDIARKLRSFTHSEYDKPEYTNLDIINERMEKGEFVFGYNIKIVYEEIDNSYPKYIQDNVEKYSAHIRRNQ